MTIGRLPNETPGYAKLRTELKEAEISLRDHRERVAELRRRLPLDTVVETDHRFQSTDLGDETDEIRECTLSELA